MSTTRGIEVEGRRQGSGSGSGSPPVVVVGGGLAGLTAAQELSGRGIPVELFEAGDEVGGLARTYRDDGFIYDIGGHFMTNRLARAAGIEDESLVVRRYGETVLLNGKTYGYPFGLMASPRFALGAARARLARPPEDGPPSANAANAFRHAYGRAMADEVAIPLLEAWSGAPAGELAASVLSKIPASLMGTMALKMSAKFTRRATAIGYSVDRPQGLGLYHVYPKEGLNALSERLAGAIEPEALHVNTPVDAVVVEGDRVVAVRAGGREIPADTVVSTIPINLLADLVEGSAALDRYSSFRFRPMIFVTMRFDVPRLLQDVFVWTPEDRFPFFRLTEATISMPWLAPEGKTYLSADIGCEVGDRWWSMDEDELAERCLAAMEPVYPETRDAYLGSHVLRTRVSYPVYLNSYEEDRLRLVEQGTGIAGLYTVGRQGAFTHLPMEDVFFRTQAAMGDVADWVQDTVG